MIDELDFTAPRHELEWRARRPAGGSDDAAAARVLGVTGAGEPQRFVESVI